MNKGFEFDVRALLANFFKFFKGDFAPKHAELGALVKRNPGWRLCVVTSSGRLAGATGLKFTKVSPPIPLGGIRLKFYLTE